MTSVDFRAALTDAIRYWEPRRLLYNFALACVVLAIFVTELPQSRSALTLDAGLTLFILAVLANVAYTAAYIPDLALQLSGYRDLWRKVRWVLLLVGTAFACALASFFARAPFSGVW